MDIGKLILLGGIGYVAYEYLLAPKAPAPTTPVSPAPSAAGGIIPATTQSLVLAAAAKANPPFTQGSADEWDTFYVQARGVAAPDPGLYLSPDQRSEILTFPEWWSLASAHGLSGYRRA